MYGSTERDKRIIKFIYGQSGISKRYSVLPDFSLDPAASDFYLAGDPTKPFPSLEKRMQLFNRHAANLSCLAIERCTDGILETRAVTHLITVTCTGLSAPGLDLQLMEMLSLKTDIFRTSVNFMGCYGAVHALKLADAICRAAPSSKVLVVCTELCTLHFQQAPTVDNITSSLLFGDGSAAVLITGSADKSRGFPLIGFYSQVDEKGKQDMAWEVSATGFKMTLNSQVSERIALDFKNLLHAALKKLNIPQEDIAGWAIHPGGRKILEAVARSLSLSTAELNASYKILREYGNMSSPTILYVLKERLFNTPLANGKVVFGAAFGPGLTMETVFIGSDGTQ